MDIFRRSREYDMGDTGKSGFLGIVPYAMSQDKNDGGSGDAIAALGQKISDQGAASSQESSQYSGSFDVGNYLKQLFGAQVGMNAAPVGAVNQEQGYQNQGPLAQSNYKNILAQSQNPSAGWQSTLQPELTQAQDQINKYYNNRGLINSGIAIGDMGTAGVDLAIKNAQNEMAYRQQAMQNVDTLSTNISGLNQQNVQNLSNLYTTQQQAGQNVASRALQATETGAGYQAYPNQAALGSYYGGIAAQQALPGQLIGAAGKLGAAAL